MKSNAQRLAERRLGMDLTQVARPLPKEGAPAVPVKPGRAERPIRPYRVNTFISEEAGARYERLIMDARAREGRHMRGSDIFERALAALEREINAMTS